MVVPLVGKASYKKVVGKFFTCLGQTIHSLPDFKVNPVVITCDCCQFIFVGKILGDISKLDVSILRSV